MQIGSEGGFLPKPVVVDGQQETTWITDPTRFDVGNVDKHSLLLAPAERADAVVDFSKFAGKTLILYNDAPAAFPARIPSYDYYTGAPDLSPVGAPKILPGYGPNTRTIMRVKVAAATADEPAAPAFNMTKLNNAFKHNAAGTGVFESSQPPTIVGQAAYNSAYGTNFAASGNCNAPGTTSTRCDGYVRVSDTAQLGFNTLAAPNTKKTVKLEPKAIHDEMNSSTFDEFGRMQANLGIEASPPTPGLQNVTLYPFTNPQTELIDATKLPKIDVGYNGGQAVSNVKVRPVGLADDGTQLWRVTHNGVDTHPIHFHLYDVQVVNRVTWDNIIKPPDPEELGWKDTVRMAPLEDTIVALRPIIPELPWEIPNSVRLLNPMMGAGSTEMFNNIDPQGNPTAPIVNKLVNFGWEYVFHCHILSHEEMDMMRPVSVAMPPRAAEITGWERSGNSNRVTFNDNSIAETSYQLQRTTDNKTWTNVGVPLLSPLDASNQHRTGLRLTDTNGPSVNTVYGYRVAALNTVGYLDPTAAPGTGFPTMTVQSVSATRFTGSPPTAPTSTAATLQAGPQVRLTWTDNATNPNNESGFVVQRSTNGGAFTQIAAPGPRINTGGVTFVDTTVVAGNTYAYKVAAVNAAGTSAFANTVNVTVPAMPTTFATGSFTALNGPNGNGNSRTVVLSWPTINLNITGFTIQRATNATFTTGLSTANVAASATIPDADRAEPQHPVLVPDPRQQRSGLQRLGERDTVPDTHQHVARLSLRGARHNEPPAVDVRLSTGPPPRIAPASGSSSRPRRSGCGH